MKKKMFASFLVVSTSFGAVANPAQEDDLKKVQDELALQKAKNELFSASYPKFEGGKTGAVEGADKLAGMAYQHLPLATGVIGKEIANELVKDKTRCSNGSVVIGGTSITAKIASAVSFTKQIELLEKEIAKARGPGPGLSATATIVAAVGALVSYAGMFKSNYTISTSAINVDMDWLISSIVMNGSNLESERFPSRNSVDLYISKLDALKENAQGVKDPKKKKELLERVDALRAAMFKPDDSGILPVVTTALLSSVAAASGVPAYRKCLAFISNTNVSPLLLTRENLFSKGGRAFLYLPVQASVIQMDSDGRPVKMICKFASVSTPINVASLTKTKGASIPWSSEAVGQPVLDDCGTSPES
jgi:hypothetical protein